MLGIIQPNYLWFGLVYLSTIIPIVSTIPALVIPVVPSMFWAIVGVYTSVIYVITSEYSPRMIRDLLLDSRMLPEKFSYLLMLVEIFAVIYQLRI